MNYPDLCTNARFSRILGRWVLTMVSTLEQWCRGPQPMTPNTVDAKWTLMPGICSTRLDYVSCLTQHADWSRIRGLSGSCNTLCHTRDALFSVLWLEPRDECDTREPSTLPRSWLVIRYPIRTIIQDSHRYTRINIVNPHTSLPRVALQALTLTVQLTVIRNLLLGKIKLLLTGW